MLLLEISHIKQLIQKVGIQSFYLQLIANLKQDFAAWQAFQKSSRYAAYVDNGVIELMPVCGIDQFSFKYVNGHPNNPALNKMTVIAFGTLSDTVNGYPKMISEMTLLTALRTAGTAALASHYLARQGSKKLAIIGCGAQSEFQVLAHHALFDLSEVHYYDVDPQAMQRFAKNLGQQSFRLLPGTDAKSLIQGMDIIVTATARQGKHHVIEYSWLQAGQHICGIGGDSPDKTELDPEILLHSKVVVEYLPQTLHEGEIQNLGAKAADLIYAELWEIVSGKKVGREHAIDLTVYDSVGFALEDYSILRLVYSLAKQHGIGAQIDLIPDNIKDCKDLYGLLTH